MSLKQPINSIRFILCLNILCLAEINLPDVPTLSTLHHEDFKRPTHRDSLFLSITQSQNKPRVRPSHRGLGLQFQLHALPRHTCLCHLGLVDVDLDKTCTNCFRERYSALYLLPCWRTFEQSRY